MPLWGAVDVLGTLKINGKSVSDTYVTVRALRRRWEEVDVVEGKQALYRRLHDRIQEETGGYHYRRTDGGGEG
ncbi:tautomerase family protein [Bacteroides ovatus]|nr:tautomerase family protein [Bacteroides ovatus]